MALPLRLKNIKIEINRSDVTKHFETTTRSHEEIQEPDNNFREILKPRAETEDEFETPTANSEVESIVISTEADEANSDHQNEKTQNHEDAELYCALCNRSFKTKTALIVHTRRHRFHCSPCNKSFATNRALIVHSRFHNRIRKSYVCPHCGKDCKYKSVFENHIRQRHSSFGLTTEDSSNFSCLQCRKAFGSQELLDRHVQSKHQNKICKFCGKVFRFKSALEIHMVVHTKEKSFQCQLCKKSFALLHRLKSHSNAHTENDFRCEPCNLSFPRKYRLAEHLAEVHNSDASSRTFSRAFTGNGQTLRKNSSLFRANYSKTQMMLTGPGKCPQCDKVFEHLHQLRAHIVAHTGEKPYQCPKCDKAYAYQTGLLAHFKKHTDTIGFTMNGSKFKANSRSASSAEVIPPIKPALLQESTQQPKPPPYPYACHLCSKVFPFPSYLKVHVISHNNERKFKCSWCSRSFNHKNQLNWHRKKSCKPKLANTKFGIKLMRCSDCDQSFPSLLELKTHKKTHVRKSMQLLGFEVPSSKPQDMQSSSIKVTNFACPHCDRTFDYEHKLNRHVVVHTDDKRFECRVCKEVFKWPVQLRYHVRREHSKRNAKGSRSQCSFCNEVFKWPIQLHYHVRRNHSGKQVTAMMDNLNTVAVSLPPISSPRIQVTQPFEEAVVQQQKKPSSQSSEMVKFSCPHCDLSFEYEHLLKSHLIVHASENGFQCTICNDTFKWPMQLLSHVKSNHPGISVNVRNPTKSGTFSAVGSTSKHRATEAVVNLHNTVIHSDQIQADIELEDQKSESSFLSYNHYSQPHGEPNSRPGRASPAILVEQEAPREIFNCDKCGKHFFRKEPLESHQRTAHPETLEKNFKCTKCDLDVSFSKIGEHMQAHRTETFVDPVDIAGKNKFKQTLECRYCERKFTCKYRLENHIKVHTGQRPYKCDIGDCQSTFITKWRLRAHQSAKHHAATASNGVSQFSSKQKQNNADAINTSRSNSTLKKVPPNSGLESCSDFECKKCGKMLSSSKCLQNHVKRHIGDSMHRLAIAHLRKNPTTHSLKTQKQLHHRFQTRIKKQSRIEPTKHTNAVNGDIPNRFKIRKLKSESYPRLQISDKKRKHICHICSKAFFHRHNLQMHIKYHLNIRDFRCDSCEQTFFQKTDLVAHQTDHTGIKPFVCHLCFAGFRYKQGLNHHLKSHETSF